METPVFDHEKFRLGVLCKRAHDFCGSGQTLRYKGGECVECVKAKAKERRAKDPEKSNAQSAKWAKGNPQKRKEIDARWYAKNREKSISYSKKWKEQNRERVAAKMRNYRRDKPEQFKGYEGKRERPPEQRERFNAYHREWAKNNPDKRQAAYHKRRATLKTCINTLTPLEIRSQRDAQNGKCFYCNCDLDNNGAGHVDHKTPLIRGGNNTVENIVISCGPCNLSKARKTAEEFFAYRSKRENNQLRREAVHRRSQAQ